MPLIAQIGFQTEYEMTLQRHVWSAFDFSEIGPELTYSDLRIVCLKMPEVHSSRVNNLVFVQFHTFRGNRAPETDLLVTKMGSCKHLIYLFYKRTQTKKQCRCPKVENLNANVLGKLLTFTLNSYVKGHCPKVIQNLSNYNSL